MEKGSLKELQYIAIYHGLPMIGATVIAFIELINEKIKAV